MQYTILSMTVVLAAGLFAGCTPSEGQSEDDLNRVETVYIERDQIKSDMKQKARSIEDYTYAQRAEFVAETKKELSDIKIELDRLSDKVTRSDDEARADAERKLTAMQEAWTQTHAQLLLADSVTEEAWNDVKHSIRKSRDGLKESFEQTRQWLSDTIEP